MVLGENTNVFKEEKQYFFEIEFELSRERDELERFSCAEGTLNDLAGFLEMQDVKQIIVR